MPIEGRVIEDLGASSTGTQRYLIKTTKVNGQDVNMKIRLSAKFLTDAEYYDTVKIKNATIYELGNDKSAKQYYKSTGVYVGAYTYEEVELTKATKRPPYNIFIKMREYINDTILALLPKDEGAVLVAMQTGKTKLMSDEAYKSFKETGLTHLFAVSGLNTSMWSLLAYDLLRSAGVRRKKSAAVSALFVVGVVALAAFSPSAMRAGIMMLVFFAGTVLDRESDSLNSLGLSALLIAITNPFSAMNIGLLLSFTATLGILILSPAFKRYINPKIELLNGERKKKILKVVAEILSVTISANLFMLPVMIVGFKAFSFVSLLSNLLTVNVASIAMVISGVGVFISAIPFISVIKFPLLFISGVMAKYILWCAKSLAKLPFAYVSLQNDYIVLWMIATILIIAVALILKIDKGKKIKLCALLSINILLCSVLADKIINRDITKIQVADVGNGSSVILSRQNHSAVIGCSGDYIAKYNIDDLLFSNNTKQIDLMLVPVPEKDKGEVAQSIEKGYNICSVVEKKKDEVLDTQIDMWNDVKIYCLSDNTASFATVINENLKVLITFSPATDVGKIPKEYQSADILVSKSKVPKGLDYKQFGIIIISDEKDTADLIVQSINSNGGNAISTSGNSIEIKTRGEKEFSARRLSE